MITRKSINNQQFIEVEYYFFNYEGMLLKDKLATGGTKIRTKKVNININYISEIGDISKQQFKIYSYTGKTSYNYIECFFVRFNSGKEYWLPVSKYSKFKQILNKRT